MIDNTSHICKERIRAYVAIAIKQRLPVITFSNEHTEIAKQIMFESVYSVNTHTEYNNTVQSRHWPLQCYEVKAMIPESNHCKYPPNSSYIEDVCCGFGPDGRDFDEATTCYIRYPTYTPDVLFDDIEGDATCYSGCCAYAIAKMRTVLTYPGCLFQPVIKIEVEVEVKLKELPQSTNLHVFGF